jgi:O-methyltransferase
VLVVGDGGPLHTVIERDLRTQSLPYESVSIEALARWDDERTAAFAGVLCGYSDAARMTAVARALVGHPVLAGLPFEFVVGLDRERAEFHELDEYAGTWFVSPVLLDDPTPYAIYRESLDHFEQKCGFRDYLDVYQLLRHVVGEGVPGFVTEFGSYRGHSGYLMARTLDALGSDKPVHLFDTFEGFPAEPLGVDHLWSRTHDVDAAEVGIKLSGLSRVHLVQGDFARTLPGSAVRPVAFAHVDCDSYRATRLVLDHLLSGVMSPGGVVVCEDYGHPALLGSRTAVHDALADRRGWLRFFSQFSGCYVIVKVGS